MGRVERRLCDMSTPHDGLHANPDLTLKQLVEHVIANANRTSKRVEQLNRLRTDADPPLNEADDLVMIQFAILVDRASKLSDEDFANRVKLLLQLNFQSYHTIPVWIDDILDELGLVDERDPLRTRVAKLFRPGPNESTEEWKQLFGRKSLPNDKDGPLAEAWEDWKKRLRKKHPKDLRIVYLEGRSPHTTGNMQSLYTL